MNQSIWRNRRLWPAVGIVVTCIGLFLLPLYTTSFLLYVATRILIFGLFAVAFNVVFGFGGMHSLGHAAFFGAGGYVAGIGATRLGLSAPLLMVVSLIVGGALGVLFGILCVRFRGIYLLLLTLALAQLLYSLAFNSVAITGGDNGIANVPRTGLPSDGSLFYVVCLSIVCVVLLLIYRLQRSPLGQTIAAQRESPIRTASSGYSAVAIYAVSFGVSGAFAALAGSMNTFLTSSSSPDTLNWLTSAAVMLYAIVGGARYFLGPFLGATILISLEVAISPISDRWNTLLGLIYIIAALTLKNGIIGWLAGLSKRRTPENSYAKSDRPPSTTASSTHTTSVAVGVKRGSDEASPI